MKSSQNHHLLDLVHVDVFTVCGKEQGKQGRSYDSKKKAVISVVFSERHQVKRVYVKCIDDYSAKSLTAIFEEHISTTAHIVTDRWRVYEPLKKL